MKPFSNQGDKSFANLFDWVIIGAETGNRKEKVIPEKDWFMPIVDLFRDNGKPIFMKNSLKEIAGEDFITEIPWSD